MKLYLSYLFLYELFLNASHTYFHKIRYITIKITFCAKTYKMKIVRPSWWKWAFLIIEEKNSCQNYVLILFVYVRNSHEQLANRHLSITLLVFLDFAKISLEKENIIEMFIEPHPEVKEKQFMILKINTFSLHTYVYMNIFISSTPSTSKNDTKKIILVSIRCWS